MMNFQDVANKILNECPTASEMQIYGFGSLLKKGHGVDIDLLVVCDNKTKTKRLEAELGNRCFELPLHVTILTKLEEYETNFIQEQNCIALARLAKHRDNP
ncbi:hypothetical protein [Litorimonas sp. WD9-15]|uniref:hypothetical protein n=1 Tax=Litorimonas sp. WD9-15 TaxID=3418716 RepID=UPI003D05A370